MSVVFDATDMEIIALLANMARSRTVNWRKINKTSKIKTKPKSKPKSKPKHQPSKLVGADVLARWLLDNLKNPYPSKVQIDEFAQTTGLTNTQIINWFANARRRWPQFKK